MTVDYPARASKRIVRTEGGLGRIPVTGVSPVLEGGAYPVKAVVHERLLIQANVFREGHDSVNASVILTSPSGTQRRIDMTQVEPKGLDIWQAFVRMAEEGDWTYRVEGWSDPWGTWLHNAEAKLPAGVDIELVCLEGRDLLEKAAAFADEAGDPVEIRDLLVKQVTGTVRWRECVAAMAAMGCDRFVEVGAGKVLTGLMKRNAPEATALAIGAPADVEAFLKTL